MESSRFASAYKASVGDNRWRQDSCTDLMRPAREWSNEFSLRVHQAFTSPGRVSDANDRFFTDFERWADLEGAKLSRRLMDEGDLDDIPHALNELNGSLLTRTSLPLMRPILQGRWDAVALPNAQIQRAKEVVAINGLRIAYQRRAMAHKYFTTWPERRSTIEGIMSEFDAAIAALEAVLGMNQKALHDSEDATYTVVPAPYSFEHGLTRKYNTDFLVVKRTPDALNVVGIQAKSNLPPDSADNSYGNVRDFMHYDMGRMAILYTVPDLNSTARVTVVMPNGHTRLFPIGGGQLCAEVARDTSTHGAASSVRVPKHERDRLRDMEYGSGTPPQDDMVRVAIGKFQGLHLVGQERNELPRAGNFVRGLLEPRFRDAA